MTTITAAHTVVLNMVRLERVTYEPSANLWLIDGDGAGEVTTRALDDLYQQGLIRRPQSYQNPGLASLTDLGEQVAQ